MSPSAQYNHVRSKQDVLVLVQDHIMTKVAVEEFASEPWDEVVRRSAWSYRSYRNKSAVVLGDYKTDPDAELERPERISLVDNATAELKIVEFGRQLLFPVAGPRPAW